MAKLSELVKKVDKAVQEGDRERALKMLESLLKKVPDNPALLARKKRYVKELELENRLTALEKKYEVT